MISVSIIIPVYNVETHIQRCVESIMAQTYGNIECIAVDDCSTDGSMRIIENLVRDYRGGIDFKIVRHDRNRGISVARNTGMEHAAGEYVFLIDGDDMLFPDSIKMMVDILKIQRVDFVIGNYSVPNGTPDIFSHLWMKNGIVNDREIIRSSYPFSWYMMAWNKLVWKQFLVDHDISFAENIVHEDDIWSFEIACHASSMGVVEDVTYHYNYNVREFSLTSFNPKIRVRTLTILLQEIRTRSKARGTEELPFTMEVIMCYENALLEELRRKHSIFKCYALFRERLHCQPLNPAWHAYMSRTQKIRFFHKKLPAPLAFIYLNLVDVALFLLRFLKRGMSFFLARFRRRPDSE